MQVNPPNFGRVAEAWEYWETWLQPCYSGFNSRLLQLAAIAPGLMVLDLGCGSGQPAILESQIVGRDGRIIALDISSEMLTVARRHALSEKFPIYFLRNNMHGLPFCDSAFDAVTARFSLMFVKDPLTTLLSIRRVLRPNGRFACSVWSRAENNPLPRSVLSRHTDVPGDDLSLPGPFRFGIDGTLPDLLREAGFRDITQEEVIVKEAFLSGKQYVQHLIEASALWGSLLLKLPPHQSATAQSEIEAAAEASRKGDRVYVPRSALLLSAMK